MSTLTSRLKLLKPAGVDNVDVLTQIDANYDIVDSEVGAPVVAVSSPLPTVPFDGQVRYDKNDGYLKVYDAAVTAWRRFSPNQVPALQGSGGAWEVNNSPTMGGITLGTGGVAWSEYIRLPGNLIYLKHGFVLGTAGLLSGTYTVDLPTAYPIDLGAGIHAGAANDDIGWGHCELTGGGTRTGILAKLNVVGPPGTVTFQVMNAAGTSTVNATTPFTFAAGSRLNVTMIYRTSA